MGCELCVKSVLGEGTTFWFDLELSVVVHIVETESFNIEGQSRYIVGFKG